MRLSLTSSQRGFSPYQYKNAKKPYVKGAKHRRSRLALDIRGLFCVKLCIRGKATRPPGGGRGFFCFFLAFFPIFVAFFRFSPTFPDFCLLFRLFFSFSAFCPPSGGSGGLNQASVTSSDSYSVYMYRVKMTLQKCQNDTSDRSK